MSAQVEKIALFIDGANLYATAKSLGFDIDYKRLLREFQSRGNLLRAFYYTAVIEDQEYSSIRPLIDWLDYNGYTVVTKATKEFVDQTGRRKVKGNMDIELAVDAMELAPHIDHMVLFSGDGDFRSLVEAVQRRGVRVTVVSTISTQPPMVADELRRQADIFTRHRRAAASKIGRDPSERPAREPREPRGERQHTPQFLQRGRAGAGAGAAPTTISRIDRTVRSPHNSRSWLAQPPSRAATARSARGCVASAQTWREREPSWFNAPVPSFGPRRRAAADRRPRAGTARRQPHRPAVHRRLCRRSALRHAEGIRLCPRRPSRRGPTTALELVDARITNAVRCVPPENKPTPAEINTCREFLLADHRRDAKPARHRGARPHRA